MAQLEERNKVSARVSYVLTRQARAEPHQPVKLALSSMDARGGAPEESGVLSDLEVAHVRRAPRAQTRSQSSDTLQAVLSAHATDWVTRRTLMPCRSARCC